MSEPPQARLVMVWVRSTSLLRKKSELAVALRLTPAQICLLNAVAMRGLVETPGHFRTRSPTRYLGCPPITGRVAARQSVSIATTRQPKPAPTANQVAARSFFA
jgi:hypothetical protein